MEKKEASKKIFEFVKTLTNNLEEQKRAVRYTLHKMSYKSRKKEE